MPVTRSARTNDGDRAAPEGGRETSAPGTRTAREEVRVERSVGADSSVDREPRRLPSRPAPASGPVPLNADRTAAELVARDDDGERALDIAAPTASRARSGPEDAPVAPGETTSRMPSTSAVDRRPRDQSVPQARESKIPEASLAPSNGETRVRPRELEQRLAESKHRERRAMAREQRRARFLELWSSRSF